MYALSLTHKYLSEANEIKTNVFKRLYHLRVKYLEKAKLASIEGNLHNVKEKLSCVQKELAKALKSEKVKASYDLEASTVISETQ